MQVPNAPERRCAYCGHRESTHYIRVVARPDRLTRIKCGACGTPKTRPTCFAFRAQTLQDRQAAQAIVRAPRQLA